MCRILERLDLPSTTASRERLESRPIMEPVCRFAELSSSGSLASNQASPSLSSA